MSALEVRGVEKAFDGVPVLRGMDLDVPAGALAAVLGPSGCGKTTLLRVIAGFERPDAGTVALAGRQVTGPGTFVPPERRRVGVVPQEGALFPHLDVAANVAFGLDRRLRRRSGRDRRVAEMLDLVGLAGLRTRMPGELSGGQQQRVAVARALACEPDVVLLDEPFSALDAGLRAAVREDVRSALRAAGATAVLVTHDQEEALSTADVVAVVRDGRVVQSGSPEQVYRLPADFDVATFVGEAVVLEASVESGVATTALGRLPVLPAVTPASAVAAGPIGAGAAPTRTGHGRVVLRPEQVRLVPTGQGVPARVVGTVFYGHDATVRLSVAGPGGEALALACRTQGPLPAVTDVAVVVDGPVCFFADTGEADAAAPAA